MAGRTGAGTPSSSRSARTPWCRNPRTSLSSRPQPSAVDTAAKLEPLRSIGADHVIDHTTEDFTRGIERYDLIVDMPGNHRYSRIRRALTPEGTYVLIGHDGFGANAGRWIGSMRRFLPLMARTPFSKHLPSLRSASRSNEERLEVLNEFIEAGKVSPVVDRAFPLADVREAMRYLEEGTAFGKIVLTI